MLSKEYVSFFKELAANNTTEWFNANKKRYETHVKASFNELTQEVINLMKEMDPAIKVQPKDCIFRINRDIRFSNDKNPYKNYMSAVVSRGGRKEMNHPGVYFQADANSVTIVGGAYEPEKEQLEKIRKAIIKDPARVNKILAAKKFAELFPTIGGEKYKVLPAEYKAAAEKAPALYHKSFHYKKEYKGQSYVTRSDLASFIVDHYKAASEWNKFLEEALGK